MDPFVPSLVLFFVLSFILVNGGGLPAILFGFAVVARLSLLVHHFSLCSNRGVLPLSCRRTHALLAAICGIICSSLLCWKIYYAFSKPVAAIWGPGRESSKRRADVALGRPDPQIQGQDQTGITRRRRVCLLLWSCGPAPERRCRVTELPKLSAAKRLIVVPNVPLDRCTFPWVCLYS